MRKLLIGLVLCVFLIIVSVSIDLNTHAAQSLPSTWNLLSDDFESGSLDAWDSVSGRDLNLVAGSGHEGSTGLNVSIGAHESYIYQASPKDAEQGYLTFWFNPNSVSIPDFGFSIPHKSVRIADVKGPAQWDIVVALRVHKPSGSGYKAYLEWRAQDGTKYDYASGAFDLSNSWQKITIGYHIDDWVAVWVNDTLIREVNGISHTEAAGHVVEIGKANTNPEIQPVGSLRYDEVHFQIPRLDHLWVDAVHGNDNNNGSSANNPLRTIQRAASLAGPGSTVHILPGVYRETIVPALSGEPDQPIVYIAENGSDTVFIRGSLPSNALAWTPLSANSIGLPPSVTPSQIYYADLSNLNLDDAPRFVVELDGSTVIRQPLAREPDWSVANDYKYHEFWWAADGGWDAAGCNPATHADPNCDYDWRSLTQLTDRSNDSEPGGIEAGNLTTLGDLTGATLIAIDSKQGHYTYRRTIIAHNVGAGRITVNETCEHDPGSDDPGLGWGTKYYVNGAPFLLDTPGEWWYDKNSRRLYLWPRTPTNPANLNVEISYHDSAFTTSGLSFLTLDSLNFEFFNESIIFQSNSRTTKSYGNTIRNATLRYANRGIYLGQGADGPASNVTNGFNLDDSQVAYIDTFAIQLDTWWAGDSSANDFTQSGIVNTHIRNNEFHHLGFDSDQNDAIGLSFRYADKLLFQGNHVHHVAHNGVQFSKSVIQSYKEYDFDPSEIKTGDILIKDNVFEQACQLNTDCGALKFWGDPPDNHVFRNVLITGNVFRDTFGWTYVSEKRRRWTGGTAHGLGGFGLYLDMVSGFHVFRNIAYNNGYTGIMASGVWRDGEIVYYNNIVANSIYGFGLTGLSFDTHGSVNTRLVNNIVLNNESHGILLSDQDNVHGNLGIDHNLYFGNGWGQDFTNPGALYLYRGGSLNEFYPTLPAIQSGTPWEASGEQGDPHLVDYDSSDHDRLDGSWPDFQLTANSVNAIDQGSYALPALLTSLLEYFSIPDEPNWEAYDIGAFEFDPGLILNGIPGNQTLCLSWDTDHTLPPGATWRIDYQGPAGQPPSPIVSIEAATRVYTLTQLTNHAQYTITLNAIVEGSPLLTSNVLVMAPTNHFVFLPLMAYHMKKPPIMRYNTYLPLAFLRYKRPGDYVFYLPLIFRRGH